MEETKINWLPKIWVGRKIQFETIKEFYMRFPDEFTDSRIIPDIDIDDPDYMLDLNMWLNEYKPDFVKDAYEGEGKWKYDNKSITVLDSFDIEAEQRRIHALSAAFMITFDGGDREDYCGPYMEQGLFTVLQFILCHEYSSDEEVLSLTSK